MLLALNRNDRVKCKRHTSSSGWRKAYCEAIEFQSTRKVIDQATYCLQYNFRSTSYKSFWQRERYYWWNRKQQLGFCQWHYTLCQTQIWNSQITGEIWSWRCEVWFNFIPKKKLMIIDQRNKKLPTEFHRWIAIAETIITKCYGSSKYLKFHKESILQEIWPYCTKLFKRQSVLQNVSSYMHEHCSYFLLNID